MFSWTAHWVVFFFFFSYQRKSSCLKFPSASRSFIKTVFTVKFQGSSLRISSVHIQRSHESRPLSPAIFQSVVTHGFWNCNLHFDGTCFIFSCLISNVAFRCWSVPRSRLLLTWETDTFLNASNCQEEPTWTFRPFLRSHRFSEKNTWLRHNISIIFFYYLSIIICLLLPSVKKKKKEQKGKSQCQIFWTGLKMTTFCGC